MTPPSRVTQLPAMALMLFTAIASGAPSVNSAKKVTTEPRLIRPQRTGSSTFIAPAKTPTASSPRNNSRSRTGCPHAANPVASAAVTALTTM